jgi:poly(A) polymerase
MDVSEGNCAREAATEIVKRLRRDGFQAYFVGGCVRDLVMEREPEDYDVATDATPAQVVDRFQDSLTIGAQFGVVAVPYQAGHIEVATFRSDGAYSDGRHPVEVRYANTPEEDVRRRDFTINGLLLDPLAASLETGLLDFVGGVRDIRAKRVRTIGDPAARFHEDRLRMLRAVRFAARFEFALDPGAVAAIRELAPEIKSVSCERIRDEILKILTEGHARRGFELLDETSLLGEVLPEIKAMQGVAQPPEFHPEGDVWTHTLIILEGLAGKLDPVGRAQDGSSSRPPSPTLALGAQLHDVGKPPTFSIRDRIRFDNHAEIGARMAAAICDRLRLPTRHKERVVDLVQQHMRFKDFPNMRKSNQLRFMRGDGFDEHLELHRIDCLSSHRNLEIYRLARHMLEETPPEEIKPPPLVRGDDLIALGYPPGPLFKAILSAVEDAQLEGRIASRDEALAFVRSNFPRQPAT